MELRLACIMMPCGIYSGSYFRFKGLFIRRLVSTLEKFPQDRNGQESFLRARVPTKSSQDKGNFHVHSCPEECFPEWKPALRGEFCLSHIFGKKRSTDLRTFWRT